MISDCFFNPGSIGSVMTFREAASSYIVREKGALVYERKCGNPEAVLSEGTVVGNVLKERILLGYILGGKFVWGSRVLDVTSDDEVFSRKVEGQISLSAFGQVELTLM